MIQRQCGNNFHYRKLRFRETVRLCVHFKIYNVSRLSVLETRKFVSEMMYRDFEESVKLVDNGYEPPQILYIIEDRQNVILPNSLRSLKFQEISRFVSQGRNFNLSYLASTQRLASTDTNLAEISGIKYWGKLEGENNLRKARSWLSKYQTWNLRNLDIGQFYLQSGSCVKLLRFPKFEAVKKVIV